MIEQIQTEVNSLHRHIRILEIILENEPIGIGRISNETGLPQHKVRYSLRLLEEESLIEPTSQGAISSSHTREFVKTYNEEIDSIISCLQELKPEETDKKRRTVESVESESNKTRVYSQENNAENSETKIYEPDEPS